MCNVDDVSEREGKDTSLVICLLLLFLFIMCCQLEPRLSLIIDRYERPARQRLYHFQFSDTETIGRCCTVTIKSRIRVKYVY